MVRIGIASQDEKSAEYLLRLRERACKGMTTNMPHTEAYVRKTREVNRNSAPPEQYRETIA